MACELAAAYIFNSLRAYEWPYVIPERAIVARLPKVVFQACLRSRCVPMWAK